MRLLWPRSPSLFSATCFHKQLMESGDMRARKRPIEVDVELFTGYNFWTDIQPFCPTAYIEKGHVNIRTLEGDMRVTPGDYVIKGVAGEFYPCKPDIFRDTYELVNA